MDLTERDKQVLESVGQDADRLAQTDDADQLRDAIDDLVDELEETKHDLKQFKIETNRRINAIEEQLDGEVSTAGSSTLEKYSSMPEDVREETLGSSERRAVLLYDHWEDIAWRGPYDGAEWCVDTKTKATQKNNPSLLKLNLERITGESLDWKEVYRTMKALARLSGGEEEIDTHGRTHIVGGDFEYHQKPTADNKSTKRILTEVGN